MNKFFTLYFILCVSILNSQLNFKTTDSLNKIRLIYTTASISTVWAGSFIALNKVWYSDFEKEKLHSFNDGNNWLQMDKIGHAYSCYHFSEILAKTYNWTGLSKNKAAILGSSVAWSYQFSIEILDGMSSAWGFSWWDIVANSAGSLIYLGQELGLKKQFIQFKFSFYPSKYAQYRPNYLGSTFSEQILKDYNAQSYWLTFSPFSFYKNSKWKWLNLALGYSVDGKLIGNNDYFQTIDGQTEFFAKREWLLSLDIDVKSLPIKKRWLKTLLSPFNSIKFPLPSIIFNGNSFYGRWLY
jgi:hypothetical protein